MKISLLYYSKTGRTRDIAQAILEGILEEAPECEVRAFPLDAIEDAFLSQSQAVVFGTPTYYANTCWQVKKWFDESHRYRLEGKLGAVFATADYIQGGADTAIMNIIGHMLVKGMLVYSGGSALGQPYLHLGCVVVKDQVETGKAQAKVFGRRIAAKANALFGAGEKA
ncbi:flavodoxin family protein [Zongyangia hominis]|uniref:NAD(P)H-dependent oxidoreductase n=1 Tax=Zongyangia hominis TaxID=2763677 RepID=A0A926ECT2_9FIRM|nr:flavodoxin domain-containing protein [Zongyangia hominis]MBC8569766.1 NAD(P)H-dependent oxidoreductase [Zongyangia hominis]